MLSLVITANHTRYLTEALTSVVSQTTDKFNIVCVADTHINDDCYKLFMDFAPYLKCNDLKIIKTKSNGTAGFVRNIGFNATESEWVTYLDGDDFLHVDAIRRVLEILDSPESKDFSVYSSGIVRVNSDGSSTCWEDSLTYLPPINIYEVDPDEIGEPTYFNQLQVIRRNSWLKYRYDETTNGEDIDFMLHQLLLGRFKKIPEYLYYFRETPDSFSSKKYEEDICTQRYKSGYYKDLFKTHYHTGLRGNFK
jgi:glycosyltransferase involved in cell wall biosynthesis